MAFRDAEGLGVSLMCVEKIKAKRLEEMVVLGNPTGLGRAAVAQAVSSHVCLSPPFLQDTWRPRPSCTGGDWVTASPRAPRGVVKLI